MIRMLSFLEEGIGPKKEREKKGQMIEPMMYKLRSKHEWEACTEYVRLCAASFGEEKCMGHKCMK